METLLVVLFGAGCKDSLQQHYGFHLVSVAPRDFLADFIQSFRRAEQVVPLKPSLLHQLFHAPPYEWSVIGENRLGCFIVKQHFKRLANFTGGVSCEQDHPGQQQPRIIIENREYPNPILLSIMSDVLE